MAQKRRQAMDIYEFALKMEKDGQDYYRKLANDCQDVGVKAILQMLADEEVKHFEILQAMQKNADIAHKSPETMAQVKNIFEQMLERKESLQLNRKQSDLYRKAHDIEVESGKFYREKASEMSMDKDRDLLIMLAVEEERHAEILANLADFVAQGDPGRWLEDAEWHNMGAH